MANWTKRGGFYWVNGRPYPSVTAIINVLEKKALRYWFGQQVYRAFAKDASLDEKSALAAPWQVSKKAKSRGSTVHSIVEAYKKTGVKIEAVPEEFHGYAKAFYKWLEDNKVTLHWSEKKVVSKNHGYAGTLDLLVSLNGSQKAMIVDVKTGKDIYPEAFLQLSAYKQAVEEMSRDQKQISLDDTLRLNTLDMAVLLLKEDGTYKFERSDESLLKEFLACKTIYEWQNKDLIEQMEGK